MKIIYSTNYKIIGLGINDVPNINVVKTSNINNIQISNNIINLFDINITTVYPSIVSDDIVISLPSSPAYGKVNKIMSDSNYLYDDNTGKLTLKNNTLHINKPIYKSTITNTVKLVFTTKKIVYKLDIDLLYNLPNPTSVNISFYDHGSLIDHVDSQMKGLISGKTPSVTNTSYIIENNLDKTSPVVTIEPTRFCSSIDLSFSAVMSQDGPTIGLVINKGKPDEYTQYATKWHDHHGCVLISPRHAWGAKHYHPRPTSTVTFMDSNGNFQTVTVVSEKTIKFDKGNGSDGVLLYFDKDVIGIPPAKIMPDGWENIYSPTLDREVQTSINIRNRDIVRFPVLAKTWHRLDNKVPIVNPDTRSSVVIMAISTTEKEVIYFSNAGFNNDVEYSGWSNIINSGDSGSAFFMVINGEAILLGCWRSVYDQPSASGMSQKIIIEMNNLADTSDPMKGYYTLSRPDLSMFKTY